MSTRKPVSLSIVSVWYGMDDRGRPVTRYEIEDANGDPVGVFLTPLGSRLSDALLDEIRRNRRK